MNSRSFVKRFIPKSLFQQIEPLGHLGEAVIFNVVNGFPARGMKVIGVTGTNGKTTTVFLLHRMLYEAGYKTGMISTVAYGVDDEIKPQMTHMTTPSAPVLMRRMKAMKDQGVEWVVLETTSQALAQHRVWGVPYSVVAFTNLTHEHLSYHKTFERYRNAKLKLFRMANANKQGLRTGVVNSDDPNGHFFSDSISSVITYGIDSGDLRASHILNSSSGVSFEAKIGSDTYHIACQIPGTFNVYNSLAAIGVGRVVGLSIEQIERGIAAVPGVLGRMTHINEGQNFTLIVDYAHTPDSFEKLFKDLSNQSGSVCVVFGSLGGGDKEKRFLQGELAGKYCETVVVCEEDDRQEDPAIITEAIAKGAEAAGKVRQKDLFLIHDRTEAIEYAVSHAQTGDLVLLLGKGHERTIERADGARPWDEIAVARKAVQKRLKIGRSADQLVK